MDLNGNSVNFSESICNKALPAPWANRKLFNCNYGSTEPLLLRNRLN